MNRTKYIFAALFLLLIINTYAQKDANKSIIDSTKTTTKIVLDTIVIHKNPELLLNFGKVFTKESYKRYGESLVKHEGTDNVFTLFGILVDSIIFITKDEKVVYFEIEFNDSLNSNNNKFIHEFDKVFDEEDIKREDDYIYYYFRDDFYRVNQTSLRFKYLSKWAEDVKTKALSNSKK